MKQDKALSQQAALDHIVALRQEGKGWGVIAHDLGVKLGHVVSDVKRAEKATDRVAGKPDKADKGAEGEKPGKPEEMEKMEKPAKPAKPSRRPGAGLHGGVDA